MRVATGEQWTDRNTNEKRERTEWHTVSVFAPNAVRYAESYLKKVDKVYIEGRLQTRKWQDQSGADRYTTEIVVNAIGGQLSGLSSRSGGSQPSYGNGGTGGQPFHTDPGDIPF